MDRGLIIKKKWLDLIFDNGKVWEMRSRPTNITGPIGLIEGGSGLIVGEAKITGWVKFDASMLDACNDLHQVEDAKLLERWPYAWVLEDAKRYDKPIPYKHPQGAVIWVKLQEEDSNITIELRSKRMYDDEDEGLDQMIGGVNMANGDNESVVALSGGVIKPDEKWDTSKTLTEKEGKVLNYLRHFNEFVKPTELAMEIFGKPYYSASSFASPICRKLVEKGLVERNKQGHYKAL